MTRPLLRSRAFLLIVAALGLGLIAVQDVSAQDRPRRRRPPADAQPQQAPQPTAPEPVVDAEEEVFLAVVGARIHTVSGETIERGTILSRNGKIVEIGSRVVIPEGAETLDATGFDLYPGFVAVRSAGIVGSGNAADSTDVYALNMTMALAAGVTTAVTGNDAAKLTVGDVEDIVLRRGLFIDLRYSSNAPNAKRRMREDFDRVVQYLRDVETWQNDLQANPEAAKPDDRWLRGNYANYLKLIKHEAVAQMSASSTHDLLEVVELADRYGIRIVVEGAIEGWAVAPELSRAGISAIITPRARQDANDRLVRPNGSTIENASILYQHGVPVTFVPVGSLFGPGFQISFGGLAGRDLQHLSMEAAFAVRGGMSNDDAIRAITLDAAKILGVDDRVGSLEVGKDADYAIFDGDPLYYMTHVRWTIVNGRIVYDKVSEGIFDHIRPENDTAPPDDYWPRRLEADWLVRD